MFLGLVFISIEGSGSMGSVLVYDVVSISIHGFAFKGFRFRAQGRIFCGGFQDEDL